jgi:hypothetical protein
MKIKQFLWPVVLILFGLAITIIASLFKIQHWQFASELLTIGMFLEAFGIILLIIKLILHVKRGK